MRAVLTLGGASTLYDDLIFLPVGPPAKKAMLFMIVENFRGNELAVYRRFRDRGRLAPAGLKYVSSWVDRDFKKYFQPMETDDEKLIEE